MGERLFSPKSLERVVRSVEWEDELIKYRDGTTNQERYMMALGELWERWIREWSIPDFAKALRDTEQKNFLKGFRRVLQSLPERIAMLKGFYEGLWYGANPGWHGVRAGWNPMPAPVVVDVETEAMNEINRLLTSLRAILKEED